MTILVTGGTGTLGKPTVRLLRAAGHELRVFSRKPGVGRVVGNLATGEGLAAALDGVDTVLHLANGMFREAAQTERLLAALEPAKIRHLFYISIVGVDKNPFAYYKQKLASERLIEASGIPFTILRGDPVPQLARRAAHGARPACRQSSCRRSRCSRSR